MLKASVFSGFLTPACGLVQKSRKHLGLENLFTPAPCSILYHLTCIHCSSVNGMHTLLVNGIPVLLEHVVAVVHLNFLVRMLFTKKVFIWKKTRSRNINIQLILNLFFDNQGWGQYSITPKILFFAELWYKIVFRVKFRNLIKGDIFFLILFHSPSAFQCYIGLQ